MLRTALPAVLTLLLFVLPAAAEEGALLKDLGAAPDFELETLDGETVRLSEALENGPVLLDFWATWCGPCRKAMPAYQQLYERYADAGLQVWAISEDSPRSYHKIEPFFESRNLGFPALLDREKKVGAAYGVQVLPTSFLVSPEGRVVGKHLGFAPKSERLLEAQIRALFDLPEVEESR